MGKELRGGFTTGAAMAAGVKAALLYGKGERPEKVFITALDGTLLTIPVKDVRDTGDGVTVEVVKDSGDDPDITNGVSVFTTVKELPRGSGVKFCAGEGIGIVTKPGLALPVGSPAINEGPRKLAENAIREILGGEADIEVTVSIPAGAELSKKTLNPVLGVEGGISVIGTTGVLRPMSEEGFKNSLTPQIDVAKAAGFDTQIFVPGKIGENIAVKSGLPREAIVQTSNFIGFMLDAAAERKLSGVMLFGHLGKLAKVSAGVFHTHNRVGDGRLEAMAAYAAAEGLPRAGVRRILSASTTEDAMPVIEEYGLRRVYGVLAARASLRAERYVFGALSVGTVLATLKGEILGMDARAREIGRDFRWSIK